MRSIKFLKAPGFLFVFAGLSVEAVASESSIPCSEQHPVIREEISAGLNNGTTYHVASLDGELLRSPAQFKAVLNALRAKRQSDAPSTTIIIGGDFTGWNFAQFAPAISGVCFYKSELANTNWQGGHYPEIGFIRSNLAEANFQSAQIPKVVFENAALRNADMRGAMMEDGRFRGGWDASAENWDLSRADMTRFRFECGITINDGCPLERDGIKFLGTNLAYADISTFPTWGSSDFHGAIFDQTKISPRQVSEVVGADITGSILLVGNKRQVSLSANEFVGLQNAARDHAVETSQPSFSCREARTAVELMICGEYQSELRALDRQMAQLFADTHRRAAGIIPAQKRWMRERNKCRDVDCVTRFYKTRIDTLMGIKGEPDFLKRGETAHYINDTIGLPRRFAGTPLYNKVAPVLAAAARMSARVTRELDGTYSIVGRAIGANAHICSLRGNRASFDMYSGWFSLPQEEGEPVPLFQIFEDQLTIIGNGKPSYFPKSKKEGYVTCGARASFSTMQRLHHDQDHLEILLPFPDEQ